MFYSVSEHCQECKRERERERAEGFEVFKKVELSGIQIEVEKNENVSFNSLAFQTFLQRLNGATMSQQFGQRNCVCMGGGTV